MNIFQRLLMRRLCSEAPVDGGAEGAPAATTGTGSVPADQEGNQEQQQGGESQPQGEGGEQKPDSEGKKPDPEKTGDQKDANKDGDKKPEGAPEAYEFKAPEGAELDKDAVAQFEPIARELNLSQEQAQKLVDLYGSKVMPQLMKQQADTWQKQVADWGTAAKDDAEIGGDKFDGNLTRAKQAMDKFATPQLREFLETTGMGNHPELIRVFVKVGAAMSEDSLVTSNEKGQRSAADVLYGKN
ncbi:peptidase [Pantoea sp. aB]|uniref:peptidase n=1 Tax=Pantoea sp. aB TaxID=517433 RepID=UPI0001E09BB3|nr:peptidase [Pantoea sp. aB]EFM18640.1 endoprotease [Pantoea sp. aB]